MRLLTPLLRACLGAAVLVLPLAMTTSLRAGIFSSDFNSGQPPGAFVSGSAFVDSFGGVGDSGVLKLTEAFNSQMGTMILDDFDFAPITGFNATFKLLIGGGSTADGFSFNFAPFYFDPFFGEEGSPSSTLTISFDTYDNTGGEAPAIDIRRSGKTIFSAKNNLDLFRTGDFVDVTINVETDGTLDLTVNGVPVVTDLLAAFPPTMGQFAFGARTGGLTDNHFVDDLNIVTTTIPAPGPTVLDVSPRGAGAPPDSAITAIITQGTSTQVNPGSVVMKLNGATVPASVDSSSGSVTVSYQPPVLLQSGADYNVSLSFADNGATPVTTSVNWDFQARHYRGPNGSFYELVHVLGGIDWESANIEAQNRTFLGRRGHLATITSEEEDALVERVRRTSLPDSGISEAWVGGFQPLGSILPNEGWLWVNNEGPISGVNGSSSYANWLPNEPNDYFGIDSENYLTVGLNGQFGWNDSGNFGFGLLNGYIVEYDALIVAIDVKPGDAQNRIQANNNGKLPVAILGSADLDVTQIKISSVRAGRLGREAAVVSSSLTDVNGDGRTDLHLLFNVQELTLICGDLELKLSGELNNGGTIRGADRVDLVNCPPYGLILVALQDVQQRTELKFTVNTLLPNIQPPAQLAPAQLKSYDLSDALVWTRNIQGTALAPTSPSSSTGSTSINDLQHLQPIAAKLQVKNTKTGQTENLYANTRVLFRPDLAVASVNAPSQVNVRRLFTIAADIQELMGDLGGEGKAYLMNGDTVIDTADFALDPGQNAGVIFTLQLPEEGTHNLKIVVVSSFGDYDPSNNERSFEIVAIKPDLEPVDTYLQYNYYGFTSFNEEENDFIIRRTTFSNESESLSQTLYIPTATTFPMQISFRGVADGTERKVVETSVAYSYSDIFDCYRSDVGFTFVDNNTTVIAQSTTTCDGFAQTTVSITHYAFDQLYLSTETDKLSGNTAILNNDHYTDGIMWRPTHDVATRFTVGTDAGVFGGNAAISPLGQTEFLYPYEYFPDASTRISGFTREQYFYGYYYGPSEP